MNWDRKENLMRTFTKEIWQLLKTNCRNILIFACVYRMITWPIFLHLANDALRFALRMSGNSYLTLGNVWQVLLSPWTIPALMLVVMTGLCFLMIEAGGLITAYSAAAYSLRLNPLDMLVGGVQKLIDEVLRKNIGLAGVLLADFFLINLFFIVRGLTHVQSLQFLMKTVMEEPIAKVIVIAALAAAVLGGVPSVFAAHGSMIEQKSFRDSMIRSQNLLKGRKIKTVIRLAVSQMALIVVLFAAYVLSVVIVAAVVVLFVDKNLEFAFLMQTSDKIEWFLLFFAGTISGVVYFAGVTVLYYQYDRRKNIQPRWDFSYAQGDGNKKKTAVISLCIIVSASAFCLFDTAYNGNFITRSMQLETGITAHRGSSGSAPENTMAAMEAAVEQMADRAEIDVQETSDGVLVIFHDNTLKRLAGMNKKISDLTYEELRNIDVGSWYGKEFAGERIPTLQEVMEYAKGKIDLNIEIKNMGSKSQVPEKVLKLVNEYEMQEQCVITSVSLAYLKQIKQLQPEIRTGYIVSAAYGDYYSSEYIDFISIRSSFVTETLMERSHEAGKNVHAWTVNSVGEMKRLKLLGVDEVITDYPVLAREILYRQDYTENILEYLRMLLK